MSGIMILRRQWLPSPLPLLRHTPPPRHLKLISRTATATAALMMTAVAVRLLSWWRIKARPPLSVFLEMSDASCWIKVKVNASKGNANVLSHEIANTMMHSVVARRTELIEGDGMVPRARGRGRATA